MPDRLPTLPDIEAACWAELQRAVAEHDHDWRLLTLATVDGERAAARTVVLRETVGDARRLRFYTDARSAKVAQLRAHPLATLMAWSPRLGWQLRLEARLEVDDDGLGASSRWARVQLSPRSARDYLTALPPGTASAGARPEQGTRAHFAVVTACVDAMDWLELHRDGHRRARFDADGARWIVP